jgi:hypothetical protein
MTATKLRKSDVAPILNLLGSDYNGRKFSLGIRETYSVNNGDLLWDGGSKTEVNFLRQVAGKWEIVSASDIMPCAYGDGAATVNVRIPTDTMIVERSWFCGTDCGYTFIVAPGSAFLPRAICASTVAGALA